jgi:hypothetical protein
MKQKLIVIITLAVCFSKAIMAQPAKGDMLIHIEKRSKESIIVCDTIIKQAIDYNADKILDCIGIPYKNMRRVVIVCDSMPPFMPPSNSSFINPRPHVGMHPPSPPEFKQRDSINFRSFDKRKMKPFNNRNDSSFQNMSKPPREMHMPPEGGTIITILIPDNK